jgi:hypothetical protein
VPCIILREDIPRAAPIVSQPYLEQAAVRQKETLTYGSGALPSMRSHIREASLTFEAFPSTRHVTAQGKQDAKFTLGTKPFQIMIRW